MTAAPEPDLHQALFYDYVDDILERRGSHRAAHLQHAFAAREAGTLRFLGALGDPVSGALGVFRASAAEVEAFAGSDPYVLAGLVRTWHVEPWAVVVS